MPRRIADEADEEDQLRPGTASSHWFYSDGMVHGVELADGRARWYRNRWVRTSTFSHNARVLRPDLTIDRSAGGANECCH